MKESQARKIFAQIFSEEYGNEEKLQAIEIVCQMPSLNGISKDDMRAAICWLAGYEYGVYMGKEVSA